MYNTLSILLFALTIGHTTTDRFYPDLHVTSKSGQYRVDATSPDNKKDGYHPFQDDFTYRCVDTKSGELIWTRKQRSSREGSPSSVMVSDNAYAIIYTAYDNIIVVSPTGKIVRKIDFINDALTGTERHKYVHDTTAGPMWNGMSISYFIIHGSREFFVIRPWWGRHVIIEVETGNLIKQNDNTKAACNRAEEKLVMESLRTRAANEDEEYEKCMAVYLAGIHKLKRAVPFLREAEKSTLIGSSTSGGLSWNERFDNEVDPHSYSTYTVRQIAQLSLRRLGEKPRPLPCNVFELTSDGKTQPFTPVLKRARHENVDRLKVGMSAKEIISLIGPPDFVSYDQWSYDMDAATPHSINITMDSRKSTAIEREEPIWLNRLDRDEALVN